MDIIDTLLSECPENSEEKLKEQIQRYNLATARLLEDKNRLHFQVNCLKASNEMQQKAFENITDQQRVLKQNFQLQVNTQTQMNAKETTDFLIKYNNEMKEKEKILLKETVFYYCYLFVYLY